MALPFEKYRDIVCEDVLIEIERVARHMRNWDMALHSLLTVLVSLSVALHGLATSVEDSDYINYIGLGLGVLTTVTMGVVKFSHFGATHTHLQIGLADLKAFVSTKTPLPKEILRDIMKINTLCYKHPLVDVHCLHRDCLVSDDSDAPSVLNL